MNLLQHINAEEIDRLLSSKTFKDKDLPLPLLKKASLDTPLSFGENRILPIKALSNFQVRLFDLADNKTIQPSDANVRNLLAPKQGEAWLAYSSESHLDINNPQLISQLGINFDVDKKIIFNSYKVHTDSQTLPQAIFQDLKDFVVIFSKSQVLNNLQINEAVSMQVAGKFKTSATVRWADIFAGSLNQLGKLLGNNESIKVQLGAKAEADFSIEVKDDFNLVICKIADNQYRISLKKAVAQNISAKADLNIGVSLQNSAQVMRMLAPMIEGIFDLPENKLKEIGEKIKADQWLDEAERQAVGVIIRRLGLSQGVDIKQIPQKIEETEKSVLELVKNIAQTKVQLGFSFEYQRLKSEDAFLQAVVSQSILEQNHQNILLFKINDLLTNLIDKEGAKIEKYLHETRYQKRVAWGLGLDFGRWGALAGKDNKSVEWSVRQNAQLKQQVSFVGTRIYKATEWKNKVNWGVSFTAQMPNFSFENIAKAHEFQYGLQIIWEQTENETEKEELLQIIDLAVLWGIIAENEFDKYTLELENTLGNTKNISYAFQIQVPNEAFVMLLPVLSRKINGLIGKALGAGMNFLNYFDSRKVVEKRAELYAPLWATYLSKYEENINWASLAQTHLKSQHKDLANYEGSYQRNSAGGYNYFQGLIQLNPNTATQVESFVAGANLLAKGIGSELPYEEVIQKSFEQMQAFWTQSHHIRSFGYYLLDIAKNPNIDVFHQINRTLTIQYQANNSLQTIQIAKK